MKYAKIIDGQVAEYPYTLVKLRADNPATSFPRAPSNELLAEYGVYPVTLTEKPAPTLTQNPVEQTPQLIEGVWAQVWGMVDVSADEANKRQIKADAFVKNFIAMSPAQVENYVANNTANLGQTRALLVKMALMLLALARREYR